MQCKALDCIGEGSEDVQLQEEGIFRKYDKKNTYPRSLRSKVGNIIFPSCRDDQYLVQGR